MNKIKGIKQLLLFIACLLPSALIMTFFMTGKEYYHRKFIESINGMI